MIPILAGKHLYADLTCNHHSCLRLLREPRVKLSLPRLVFTQHWPENAKRKGRFRPETQPLILSSSSERRACSLDISVWGLADYCGCIELATRIRFSGDTEITPCAGLSMSAIRKNETATIAGRMNTSRNFPVS